MTAKSSKMQLELATLVQSAMLRTRGVGVSRPAPSSFYYPGLRNVHPIWKTSEFEWVPKLEASHALILKDYLNLKQQGIKSDYKKEPSEATHGVLHKGVCLCTIISYSINFL